MFKTRIKEHIPNTSLNIKTTALVSTLGVYRINKKMLNVFVHQDFILYNLLKKKK